MRRLATAAAIAAAVSLTAAPAALAGLPKPSGPVKVPTSLGGVKIGMKIKAADKAWGKTGKCSLKDKFKYCQYDGGTKGSAQISSEKKSKVASAGISAGIKGSKYKFKGPLMKFETKEGIGLGDKPRKVGKAYPKAKKIAGGYGYYVPGKGKSAMTFYSADQKHITTISVSDGTQG